MPMTEIVRELRRIHAQVGNALRELEGGNQTATTGRRARTPEMRAAQSEKMKLYWASRKAGKKLKRVS